MPAPRIMPAILVFWLLAACAPSGISHLPPPSMDGPRPVIESACCPPAVQGPATRRSGAGGEGSVLARVGGREIVAEDIARELFRANRQQAMAILNKLVVREIVQAEARRIGLAVPDSVLAAERARVIEDLKVRAATTYGVGTTPERFLEIELKQSLAEFLRQRDAEVAERWLLSRIMRFHAIRAERVELQLIAVDDEKLAREIAGKLDQGADFAQLAMAHSKHPSGQGGGKLPPLARESLNPAVAERAFALAPGARSNILSVDDGVGHRQFELIKLLRRLPGRALAFSEAAPEIEEGLKLEPITQEEFIAWNLRLERLYDVWVDETL